MVPNDLKIEATLTYQQVKDTKALINPSAGGSMQRSGYTSASIPSAFFLNPIEPSKESLNFQITLSMVGINFLASLPEVFSDLLNHKKCDESMKQRRNMSFEYLDGSIVSLMVSKDEKKVKIVASELPHLCLVLKEMLNSLSASKEITDIV